MQALPSNNINYPGTGEAQPALHMRPTMVPNGFLYGAFVGSLYWP